MKKVLTIIGIIILAVIWGYLIFQLDLVITEWKLEYLGVK